MISAFFIYTIYIERATHVNSFVVPRLQRQKQRCGIKREEDLCLLPAGDNRNSFWGWCGLVLRKVRAYDLATNELLVTTGVYCYQRVCVSLSEVLFVLCGTKRVRYQNVDIYYSTWGLTLGNENSIRISPYTYTEKYRLERSCALCWRVCTIVCMCVSAWKCILLRQAVIVWVVRFVIMFLIINMWLFFMDRKRLMVVLLFTVDFSFIKLWQQTSGYSNSNSSQKIRSSSNASGWMVMAQDSIMDSGMNKRGEFL